jgi:hypothetical protein
MPTGYIINGTDFDNLFKPRVGTAGAACGYNVVTSTNPYVTQDLASRYEPSRGAGDRIPELTGLKNSAGVDLRDLFMNVGFQIIPTYTIVANKTSINETTDRTVTFTLTTTDVPNGTVLYVSLTRSDLTLSASTITVNSNTASFSATALDDATAEGYVTFQAILRTGSQSGPEVKRSDAIGLIDSSIPIPTYSIAPSLSAINEGGSVTFNVSTTNVNPGTTLYWTTSRSDVSPSSGSITISNNSASFSVTATVDLTTEGYTTFTASLRTGSTSGGILTTSAAVGINDTSTTPPTYPDTLTFDIRQFAGDCWRLFVSGSNSKTYRVICNNSSNTFGSKKDRSFTFNPTTNPSIARVSINDQGWNGNRFNIETISLLDGGGSTIKTWDIQKSFYTGSNIDGFTTAKFTITNLSDTSNPNVTYSLTSNAVSSGTAKAVFTVGVV